MCIHLPCICSTLLHKRENLFVDFMVLLGLHSVMGMTTLWRTLGKICFSWIIFSQHLMSSTIFKLLRSLWQQESGWMTTHDIMFWDSKKKNSAGLTWGTIVTIQYVIWHLVHVSFGAHMVMTLYSLYAWRIGQEGFLEPMSGIMRFQVYFGFIRTILL